MFAVAGRCSAAGGGDAATFLSLSGGARSFAMGGVSVAIADQASVLTGNPAAVALQQTSAVAASIRILSMDRRHSTVSYTRGLRRRGGIGLGWVSAGVGGIEGRDMNERRTGAIGDNENAFIFTFAQGMGEKVAVGLNLAYLDHRLGPSTATGFALDAGVVGQASNHLIVGGCARGLGGRLSWKTPVEDRSSLTDDDVAVRCALGGAYTLASSVLSAEVEWSRNSEAIVRLGASARVASGFDAMAGVVRRSGWDGGVTPSFGFAAVIPGDGRPVQLSYAYAPDAIDAGGVHVFTILAEIAK